MTKAQLIRLECDMALCTMMTCTATVGKVAASIMFLVAMGLLLACKHALDLEEKKKEEGP